MHALKVGPAIVYPRQRRLFVAGAERRLGGRAFDLLLALLGDPGRTYGREELFESVWADAAVEPNNLAVQLLALRRLLGRDAIVTVPRRGYRLVAQVGPLGGVAGEADAVAGMQGTPPLQACAAWLAERLVLEPWITLAGPEPAVTASLAAAVCELHGAAHGRVVWSVDGSEPGVLLREAGLPRRLARTGALVLVRNAGSQARAALAGWLQSAHAQGGAAGPAADGLRLLVTAAGAAGALHGEALVHVDDPAWIAAARPPSHHAAAAAAVAAVAAAAGDGTHVMRRRPRP